MMRRIVRRLRAIWYRRELRWALAELGVANLDELAACLERGPLSPAERRFHERREEILARRNPELLAEEALRGERLRRAVGAVMGGRDAE
jgi:hypothetical protein